jgi:hypothetical protein
MNKKKIKQFYKKYKEQIWLFFFTQAIVPFETVFAFYCMYGGVSGILKLGIASTNFIEGIGEKLALAFNIWYLVAGVCLYFGVGLRKRSIEVFGLVSIITSLFVRMFVISVISGFDSTIVGVYVINTAFIIACFVRMKTLFKYTFYLKVSEEKKTIEEGITKNGH